MKRYGVVNNSGNDWSYPGLTLQEVKSIIPDWKNNAEVVGEDLGEVLGDLAIGPQLLEDLVKHIEELEAKIAT